MTQTNHQCEAVTGYDLCNIQTRLAFEKILNSVIFPDLSCHVDLSPHNNLLDLRALRCQNCRITLYVPLKLSFTIDQMIAAIYSACESDVPDLIELIMSLQNDPDEIEKIKKLLNGKLY